MSGALTRMPDGTVKQVGPLTGTVAWTVPGRGDRPLPGPPRVRHAVDPGRRDALCAFCPDRTAETTPEKARLVRDSSGARILRRLLPGALHETRAEVRRFANLFEIVSASYWRLGHGFAPDPATLAWARAYAATDAGRAHLDALLSTRAGAAGVGVAELDEVDLFAGSHDVVVARRHLADGATFDDELAGSGALSPAEHRVYVAFTIDALRETYAAQPAAATVAVFQNWLRPAGASFDHLHKQVVAIDELGPQLAREIDLVGQDRHVYSLAVLGVARREGLVVAANDGAVAIAGFGHRYPTLELYSTSRHHLPWEHPQQELDAVADLLHALHAATGSHVPTNEEWHHRPPAIDPADAPMPWRIELKWRISTLAGFEGGTRINVNTIDPGALADRVRTALTALRAEERIAPVRIGAECTATDVVLQYAR